VSATAQARAQAFGQAGLNGDDRVLPAIFFSAGVDPDMVRGSENREAESIDALIAAAKLRQLPVFCAREDFLQIFWAMLGEEVGETGWEIKRGTRPSVLVIGPQGSSGLGKTRLLQELARETLLNGHLPLLLSREVGIEPPQDVSQLAAGLAKAMVWLGCTVFGADEVFGSGLKGAIPADLTEMLQTTYYLARVVEELSGDAYKLRRAAARVSSAFTQTSLVVVLIDDMGPACEPLLDALFKDQNGLNKWGLGEEDSPVPVVLVMLGDDKSKLRSDIGSGVYAFNHEWLAFRKLEPFKRHGEDMLAYELVLLNPFKNNVAASQPLVFRRYKDEPARWQHAAELAHQSLRGLPRFFSDVVFDEFVRQARRDDIVVSADDGLQF
jgi:hypothetical protein